MKDMELSRDELKYLRLLSRTYPTMQAVSTEIINKVKGVNRVCYDISSKPPSTIEWE